MNTEMKLDQPSHTSDVKPEHPNPVDVHVGNRLRLRRTLLGLSQQKVAERLGVSFQQIQKYEKGTNRVSAGVLWELSAILHTPIAYFFEEMAPETAAGSPKHGTVGPSVPKEPEDPMWRRETLELIRAYYRISSDSTRRQIYELAKQLSAETIKH